MNSYFSKCSTVEEVKSLYRTLAKQNHPDLGGDTATMQEINIHVMERTPSARNLAQACAALWNDIQADPNKPDVYADNADIWEMDFDRS